MYKKIFYTTFGIICAAILVYQGILNYNLTMQPPSKTWAKEVQISKGDVKCYPRILKNDSNYVIAHDDGDKIKIVSVDNVGKKLSEKIIPAQDSMVRNLNFLTDGKDFYLNWLTTKNGTIIIKNVKLDKKFNKVSEWDDSNVVESAQAGDNVLIYSYKNSIKVMDLSTGNTNIIKAASPTLLSGCITPQGLIVTYNEIIGEFKFFTIKDNVVSDVKLAGKMMKRQMDTFDNIAIASDGKYGYILVEVKEKGAFGKINSLMFNLDGSGYKSKEFKVGYLNYLYNPSTVSSGNEARFMAGSERPFGKKGTQYDIVDFRIKNGEISKYDFMSRTNASTMFPAENGEMGVFCDVSDEEDMFNVYVTSQNAQFKELNNKSKNFEWGKVFSDTLQGIINTLIYLFVYGARWILLGLVLISLLTFFNFAFRKRMKLILYTLCYFATAAIKLYFIYQSCYVTFAYMLPEALASPFVGMTITLLFSIISFAYGITKYKENLDAMPIGSYILALFYDSIMTQLLFIPFIII